MTRPLVFGVDPPDKGTVPGMGRGKDHERARSSLINSPRGLKAAQAFGKPPPETEPQPEEETPDATP